MQQFDGRRERGLVAFSQRAVWPLGALILVLTLLQLSPLPLKHVFTILFSAVLLSAAVAPPARALARRGVPRPLTILAIYLFVILLLVGVVALVVPLVVSEVDGLRAALPQYASELQRQVARVSPQQAHNFSTVSLVSQVSGKLTLVASKLTDIFFTLISTSIDVILILVMAFFMADEENFAKLVISRFVPPPQRPQVARVMGRIGTRLGQWARAQLLLALFFGVAFGVGLRLLGVHYAVTLGVIGGVLEVIPYVGGFITVVLAVLIALTQKPILVVGVLIWYTVVVELEGHVIAPKLMDRVLGIHPLVIVVSLFLGGEALGILGALLAVPIAIVFQVVLDEFYMFHDDAAPSAMPPENALQPVDGQQEATPESARAR